MAFNHVYLWPGQKKTTPVGEGSADLVQTCALRFGRQTEELLALDEAGFIYLFSFPVYKHDNFPYLLTFRIVFNIAMVFPCCIFNVPPDLVLNVTTKTDTIWSFSSHFTVLSSSDTSLDPVSEGCSSLSVRSTSSLPAGVLEVAGGALQPSALETDLLGVGPPRPPLHPNPGAEHPNEARLLEGLDSRSFAADCAAPPGFSADGTSSQSNRGARSDRSTILSAVPPRQSRRGL